jgi:hypothetical protein
LTATTYKNATLPTVGGSSGTWGTELNGTTLPVFDAALGGISTVSLASTTPVTLSATQSGTAILRLTGTITKAINVVTSCQGFTFVENMTSGAFAVTIDNGVGTPVTVPQGYVSVVVLDATNGPYLATGKSPDIVNYAALALTSQNITASSSTVAIDMSLGWVVNLTLSHSVTAITVTNWPAAPTLGKLILNITQGGAYTMAGWPGTTKWTFGVPPVVTTGAGANDTIMLLSNQGGTAFQGYYTGKAFA